MPQHFHAFLICSSSLVMVSWCQSVGELWHFLGGKMLWLNFFGPWKERCLPSHLPNNQCKAGHANWAGSPADHLPSVLELHTNVTNSWKIGEPWMQFPINFSHVSPQRFVRAALSCLLFPMSFSCRLSICKIIQHVQQSLYQLPS